MINHQFNKKCEIQRASLAGYTKIFINCNLKAEKSLERLGSELNYKNIIDQKDVKLSTSTILLHQSQNPDWSEVGNWDIEGDIWLKALENIKSLNLLRFF